MPEPWVSVYMVQRGSGSLAESEEAVEERRGPCPTFRKLEPEGGRPFTAG